MNDSGKSSTKKVLERLGLIQDEIETYFKITGRGPVTAGEIALISKITENRANEIALNLLEKGLVRKIPGKTPHFMVLPPYTALLGQIRQFKDIVTNIQSYAPQSLKERLKSIEIDSSQIKKLGEFRNTIHAMKEELPIKIREQFKNYEQELEKVKRFDEIKDFINSLKEIVPDDITKEFAKMESRVEVIKNEISSAFETQFRVGAIKKMAEKIVARIMKKEFYEMVNSFKFKFVQTTQGMLDKVINQLGGLSDTAGNIKVGLSDTINNIETGLQQALENLDNDIMKIYEDVLTGIQELKNSFEQEIFKTLNQDVIINIFDQLDLSEKTMEEFLETEKEAPMLSFQDVWFVRSSEGMRAQINESISRIKMRAHIIAPKLNDIDISVFTNVPKHVNVRISTNFDINNQDDRNRITELEKYPNIVLRHYSRENIWSINKDFEEVVVCVVAKNREGKKLEIAGMGSILEEHVKLFAGILEDVWIQSKKLDQISMKQAYKSIIPTVKPSKIKNLQDSAPKPLPKVIKYQNKTKKIPLPHLKQEKIPTPISSLSIKSSKKTSKEVKSSESLNDQFNHLEINLKSLTGIEVSSILINIKDNLIEQFGYSSVLNQINLSIAQYQNNNSVLNSSEIKDLLNKIKFWRNKLKIKK
ncbi:MAG: hypothetical protein KGD63_10870 [Candidatus Lokiarchaeota archaeon]|nr:hypothetical protein [Candidatus Lokiarchaeota archaeon]